MTQRSHSLLRNEERPHACLTQPTTDRPSYKLWAAGTDAQRWSAANGIRSAANGAQVLQYVDHLAGDERSTHLNGQTLANGFVDYGQQLQLPTILRPVHQKVLRPHVIDSLGAMTNTAVLAATRKTTFSLLFSRYLHLFLLPESVDTLSVHMPITLDQ